MDKRRSRTASALGVEALDSRVVLSTVAAAPKGTLEVLHKAATTTTVAVQAGTLAQPLTFTATVRAPASAGTPTGSVNIVEHGDVIETIPLIQANSTSSKYDVSTGTATLTQMPGGSGFYFGKHAISAFYTPDSGFAASKASKSFTVAEPNYTKLADGTEYETVTPGTGPAIQAGQTASVLYTGYLAKNGKIFDDSFDDGGTPFSFKVGAGQVVAGFDAGTAGMTAGETRVILIPPADGYGKNHSGIIPANSTLIFVVTLQSIS